MHKKEKKSSLKSSLIRAKLKKIIVLLLTSQRKLKN